MSNRHLKYLRTEVIEDITTQRIREYEAKSGGAVTFPVPIEELVEQVLGLDFDWDIIHEQPGEQILGGLDAKNRKILLNESHCDLFDEKPGLLRSTIGHEAGHWDLEVDRAKLAHPQLPGFDLAPCAVNRHVSKADGLIEVLFTKAMTDDRAYRVYKQLTDGQDAPEVRSAVDRYQSALLVKIERLEELGHELRRPEADYLRDDIYELRVRHGSVNYRMLYFFTQGIAMISHGLTKEDTVPDRDISLAMSNKAKFEHDPEVHTYKE